jgi:hypothetical protein
MADKDSTIEKVEKAGKKLVDKLFGSPKKAADAINAAPSKTDAEIKKQTGETDNAADDSKGVDKGELGKKWEDTFHF